jgi:transcriptional regulator with GAF, ATPase, and Fis domain
MRSQRSLSEPGVGFNAQSDLAYPSAAFRRTIAELELFAGDNTATILLVGESGTGKSTLGHGWEGSRPSEE